MALDIAKIAATWKQDQPRYEELGRAVAAFIRKEVTSSEILPEISFRTKDLLSLIKKNQKETKKN